LARLETFGILLVNGKKAQPTHEEGLPLSARKLLNHEDKAVALKRELSSFVDAREQDGHDYHCHGGSVYPYQPLPTHTTNNKKYHNPHHPKFSNESPIKYSSQREFGTSRQAESNRETDLALSTAQCKPPLPILPC
jgi:hypothetical protein